MSKKKNRVITLPSLKRQEKPAMQQQSVLAPPPKKWDFSATDTTTANLVTPLRTKASLVAPRVFYAPTVLSAIYYLVDKCPQEIGWLGTVQVMGNDYYIDQIYVPQQIVSGTETDISPEAMAALAIEIMDAGKDPGALYYWGHSHVNMGVTPSGQDETQINMYLDNCPVFIRGIYNKSRKQKVDVFDTRAGMVFQNVNAGVHYPMNNETKARLDALITNNVKTRTYQTTTSWSKPDRDAQGNIIIPPVESCYSYNTIDDEYVFPRGIRIRSIDIPADKLLELDALLATKFNGYGGYRRNTGNYPSVGD